MSDGEAERDESSVTTIIGVDKDDSTKTAKIAVNPDVDSSGLPGLIVQVAE